MNGRQAAPDRARWCCRWLMVAIGLALIVAGTRRARRRALAAPAAGRAVHRGRLRARLHRVQARSQRVSSASAGPTARASPSWRSRSRVIARRSIGSPILFTIVYSSLASAIYFSLGVIAGHALGLTPLVFLIAALLFALTDDDLRRGRLAAPGPRRLDGVRALRVQRARQLHRRLGDPARLRDPDRRHVLLGDAVPEDVLEPARQPRRGARAGARVHRARRAQQHPRLQRPARAPRRASCSPATSRCRASSSCSASRCSSTRTRCRLDPPRHRADVVGPDLRADDRGDLVHEPRVRVGARRARCGSAAPGSSASSRARPRPWRSCTSASRLVAVTALPVQQRPDRTRDALPGRADDRRSSSRCIRTGSRRR